MSILLQVNELRKIGGRDLKSVTVNLVKRLFSNEMAQKFSWEGKKKKRRFCDLQLCKMIMGGYANCIVFFFTTLFLRIPVRLY